MSLPTRPSFLKLRMLVKWIYDTHLSTGVDITVTLINTLGSVYSFGDADTWMVQTLPHCIKRFISTTIIGSWRSPAKELNPFSDDRKGWNVQGVVPDGMSLRVSFRSLEALIESWPGDSMAQTPDLHATILLYGPLQDGMDKHLGFTRLILRALRIFVLGYHEGVSMPSYWLMRFADGANIWSHVSIPSCPDRIPQDVDSGPESKEDRCTDAWFVKAQENMDALVCIGLQNLHEGPLVYHVLAVMARYAWTENTTVRNALIASALMKHSESETLARIYVKMRYPHVAWPS